MQVNVNQKGLKDIPSFITVEIRDSNNRPLQQKETFNLRMSVFCKHLTSHLKPINILFFGLAGSTKSSFINGVSTLLSDSDEIKNPAAAGGNSKHITTSLVRYKSETYLPESNIHLWDTWGLTNQTYKGEELGMIINGQVPSNWEMGDVLSAQNGEIQKYKDNANMRAINAILFFVPQAALGDPSLEPVRKSLQFYFAELVTKYRFNPIVVITRVDEINNQIRSNPNCVYPDLEQLRERAAKLLNIGVRNVFLLINYCTERTKSFEIDRMTFEILNEAICRWEKITQETLGKTKK